MNGKSNPIAQSLAGLAASGGYMSPTCGQELKNMYNSDTQIYVTRTAYEPQFANNNQSVSLTISDAAPSQGGALRGLVNCYPSSSPAYSGHNLVIMWRAGTSVSLMREVGATETGKYKFYAFAG